MEEIDNPLNDGFVICMVSGPRRQRLQSSWSEMWSVERKLMSRRPINVSASVNIYKQESSRKLKPSPLQMHGSVVTVHTRIHCNVCLWVSSDASKISDFYVWFKPLFLQKSLDSAVFSFVVWKSWKVEKKTHWDKLINCLVRIWTYSEWEFCHTC